MSRSPPSCSGPAPCRCCCPAAGLRRHGTARHSTALPGLPAAPVAVLARRRRPSTVAPLCRRRRCVGGRSVPQDRRARASLLARCPCSGRLAGGSQARGKRESGASVYPGLPKLRIPVAAAGPRSGRAPFARAHPVLRPPVAPEQAAGPAAGPGPEPLARGALLPLRSACRRADPRAAKRSAAVPPPPLRDFSVTAPRDAGLTGGADTTST